MSNFKPYDIYQQYLMPPSLKDWLPEDHIAWFIIEAVDQFDLRPFYSSYNQDGVGASAYDPRMMVRLLIYAYCHGIFSSRKIESACHDSVAFRVICGNSYPDHTTICRFRKDHAESLAELFTQILILCDLAGIVRVGTVSLDGTKIQANASLGANREYGWIRDKVEAMLSEANHVDEDEEKRYGEGENPSMLPKALRHREERLQRLQACKARLEHEQEEKTKKQEAKHAKREEEEKRTGKKKRGRKPKPARREVDPEAKANVTDPESRIMKTGKGYLQGYNAQSVVTEDQIILAGDVTQEENDLRQLTPMMTKAREEIRHAGVKKTIRNGLGDAGYWDEDAVNQVEQDGIEAYIATKKSWKHRKEREETPAPRGRIPRGLTAKERMERKLCTKRGGVLYGKRKWMSEGVFGYLKTCLGFDSFSRRGHDPARWEWVFVCGVHNLLKLYRMKGAVPARA